MEKNNNPLISTKTVVAIGLGAALYFALSYIQIPIGPNTSLRPAVAILTILGAVFGPIASLFAALIGHALFDALNYGGVWWSWVALSAVLGLLQGLIYKNKSFNVNEGKCEKTHIALMAVFTIIGILLSAVVAYLGDVYLYGEPATKVIIQLGYASIANIIVVFVIGIPSVISIAISQKKNTGFDN